MDETRINKAFKALGEPTRFKIVKLLSQQSMCVCELSEVLDMHQPRISQHLRILKEADLVMENRQGFWTYYELNREEIRTILNGFSKFLDVNIAALNGYEEIHNRLMNLSSSPEKPKGNKVGKASKS